MRIENLDDAVRLSTMRDKLISMKRNLSKENGERRIRVQFHAKPDDCWDDVSSDDRLLELVEYAIDTRLKEVEKEIMEIE
jgi:hypothetical protein